MLFILLWEEFPEFKIQARSCLSWGRIFSLTSTPEEISDIIINLKNSSSSGVDNILIKLIKLCKSEFSSVLAHINNHSLQEGVFPDQLKMAKVVPIYKSGCKKSVSNYRPISVLSAFSKITEKIVYNRLERYLIENSILHKNQYGFRSKLSTSMALLELLDQLSYSIDNKNYYIRISMVSALSYLHQWHCLNFWINSATQ